MNLRPLPKVVLHDHLDGGVRVATILELADQIGHTLPATDPAELAEWFDQRHAGDLATYLGAFDHTLAVMQDVDSVERIAYESAVDLADDGVVYAESRFAPLLCTDGGEAPEAIVEAALAGFDRAGRDRGIIVRLILDAMRQYHDSDRVAHLAVRMGAAGFDLAGPERGNPPERHLAACRYVRRYGLGLTIHAGEGDGPASIGGALTTCGAMRIGHGVRIVDACRVVDGRLEPNSGLARRLRDERIPLEVCPTSNLATMRLEPVEHPVGLLYRAGFNVTINPDNRLMSATSMTGEFAFLAEHQGFTLADFETVTLAALEAAFVDEPTRRRLRDEVIRPGYSEAAAAST